MSKEGDKKTREHHAVNKERDDDDDDDEADSQSSSLASPSKSNKTATSDVEETIMTPSPCRSFRGSSNHIGLVDQWQPTSEHWHATHTEAKNESCSCEEHLQEQRRRKLETTSRRSVEETASIPPVVWHDSTRSANDDDSYPRLASTHSDGKRSFMSHHQPSSQTELATRVVVQVGGDGNSSSRKRQRTKSSLNNKQKIDPPSQTCHVGDIIGMTLAAVGFQTPPQHAVLLGRGQLQNQHQGNQRYRISLAKAVQVEMPHYYRQSLSMQDWISMNTYSLDVKESTNSIHLSEDISSIDREGNVKTYDEGAVAPDVDQRHDCIFSSPVTTTTIPQDKQLSAARVVDSLRQQGFRFMKKGPDSLWRYVYDRKKEIEKVKQAFRNEKQQRILLCCRRPSRNEKKEQRVSSPTLPQQQQGQSLGFQPQNDTRSSNCMTTDDSVVSRSVAALPVLTPVSFPLSWTSDMAKTSRQLGRQYASRRDDDNTAFAGTSVIDAVDHGHAHSVLVLPPPIREGATFLLAKKMRTTSMNSTTTSLNNSRRTRSYHGALMPPADGEDGIPTRSTSQQQQHIIMIIHGMMEHSQKTIREAITSMEREISDVSAHVVWKSNNTPNISSREGNEQQDCNDNEHELLNRLPDVMMMTNPTTSTSKRKGSEKKLGQSHITSSRLMQQRRNACRTRRGRRNRQFVLTMKGRLRQLAQNHSLALTMLKHALYNDLKSLVRTTSSASTTVAGADYDVPLVCS